MIKCSYADFGGSGVTVIYQQVMFKFGVALCTVGAAMLALGASQDVTRRYLDVPATVFVTLMVCGGILATFGALLFVTSFVIPSLRAVVSVVIREDIGARYICSHARPHDSPRLHKFYEKYFGTDVPTTALMRKWIRKHPAALTIVERITVGSPAAENRELVGSFKVLPLTKGGQQDVEAGRTTGSTLETTHICGPRSRPSAYYVGDVAATTAVARGIVMAQLEFAFPTSVDAPIIVLARPLTSDGLRVMTKHGFVLASDGVSAPRIGQICKLYVAPKTTARAMTRQRKAIRRRQKPPALAAAVQPEISESNDTKP